jgi:LacI family transcriptional regulator
LSKNSNNGVKRNSTIDDVAALSKVGRTTVSRVLNNGPNVRDSVRKRVLEAVKQLNYRVNVQARSLASGKVRQIALFNASNFDTEPNSYYTSAIEIGALRKCAELGYQAFSHTINQNSPSYRNRIIEICESNNYHGIILTPPFSDDVSLINILRDKNIRSIGISSGNFARKYVDSVGMDDELAGYRLTELLIKNGHRRFAFIKGLENHMSAELRFDGFKKALADYDLTLDEEFIFRGNFTFKSGIENSVKVFEKPNFPNALICANDDTAAGALFSAHRLNIKVPETIVIAGFDDTPVSEIVWPPLTTVHQPLKKIAARAVERLVFLMQNSDANIAPENTVIDFDIMVRHSTASVTID